MEGQWKMNAILIIMNEIQHLCIIWQCNMAGKPLKNETSCMNGELVIATFGSPKVYTRYIYIY